MNKKLKDLIDIYFAKASNNIISQINHFDKITNSLFILTQSLFDNKEKIEYFQRELEGKFFRFGLANQSLINLIKGNEFNLVNQNAKIVDIFSINSITRMQIESFLIIYYLLFDDISTQEKNFRYNVYKLHGLQKQLEFNITSDFPKRKEFLNKIKKESNEAIKNIKNSEIYNSADKKTQYNYLNPKYAKLIKSKVLFEKSGIKDERVDEMWKIYSNYAHSEHISDRQYNSIYRIEKSVLKECSLVLSINSILTSKIIINFINQFESVKNKYLQMSADKRNQVEFWSKMEDIKS
ncbi:hypothetical protein [Mesonia sp. K7]|uniref:hypothetical protein n=1 Tax=Mesonia sp. K7 TaxID=2218606 RepID=UPI0011B6EA05|nr:hypothetical protein [Mesonia sp. K7]